jgi:hypothetical protein
VRAFRAMRWTSLAMIGVALLASCGGGSSSASDTTKPTAATLAPGSAKVTSFDVGTNANCAGKPNVTTHVAYATSGAKSVKLLVDGGAALRADGTPLTIAATAGQVDVAVHCDPLPHTFVLVAIDASGHQTTKQVQVTTTQ